jgi:hypothetical protein
MGLSVPIVAETRCSPTVGPSVQIVVADPWVSVIAVADDTDPPPAST